MSEVTQLLKDLFDAGLTQSEISRKTQIPQPRISRWASGDVPAGADDSLKLQRLHSELCPPPPEGQPEQQG